eukprot:GILJ01004923.1.p5 GENE.GILJ01004923.1~~GILJ01004923.1.p5  ORF type:complete len:131 (-),score=22.72 GILJ01004923.1:648-1040(-)
MDDPNHHSYNVKNNGNNDLPVQIKKVLVGDPDVRCILDALFLSKQPPQQVPVHHPVHFPVDTVDAKIIWLIQRVQDLQQQVNQMQSMMVDWYGLMKQDTQGVDTRLQTLTAEHHQLFLKVKDIADWASQL